MDASWAVAAGLTAAAGAAGYFTFRLAGGSVQHTQVDPEWLEKFTPARYRPLERLLSDADGQWLAKNGLEPTAIERLMSERRKLFRLYLDNMERDFERLHSAARDILLTSGVDRPELVDQLVRLRVEFQRKTALCRAKLMLHSLGVTAAPDVSFLVRAIESMHSGWQEMAGAPHAA